MVGISLSPPVVARLRSAAVVMGPAFVVAVAYVDPGNFATNMAGGAAHGYLLLWVIVGASALAMFIQYQSAKLGVVTGRNLPQLCRERYPRPVTGLLWVQAELVAMATASACTHSPQVTGRGSRSRHSVARSRPVARPSLAVSDWMSIAMRLAATITHSSV